MPPGSFAAGMLNRRVLDVVEEHRAGAEPYQSGRLSARLTNGTSSCRDPVANWWYDYQLFPTPRMPLLGSVRWARGGPFGPDRRPCFRAEFPFRAQGACLSRPGFPICNPRLDPSQLPPTSGDVATRSKCSPLSTAASARLDPFPVHHRRRTSNPRGHSRPRRLRLRPFLPALSSWWYDSVACLAIRNHCPLVLIASAPPRRFAGSTYLQTPTENLPTHSPHCSLIPCPSRTLCNIKTNRHPVRHELAPTI